MDKAMEVLGVQLDMEVIHAGPFFIGVNQEGGGSSPKVNKRCQGEGGLHKLTIWQGRRGVKKAGF